MNGKDELLLYEETDKYNERLFDALAGKRSSNESSNDQSEAKHLRELVSELTKRLDRLENRHDRLEEKVDRVLFRRVGPDDSNFPIRDNLGNIVRL